MLRPWGAQIALMSGGRVSILLNEENHIVGISLKMEVNLPQLCTVHSFVTMHHNSRTSRGRDATSLMIVFRIYGF